MQHFSLFANLPITEDDGFFQQGKPAQRRTDANLSGNSLTFECYRHMRPGRTRLPFVALETLANDNTMQARFWIHNPCASTEGCM